MFVRLTTQLLTLALAAFVVAAPALQKRANMVIGYRTVSASEAKEINEEGFLVYKSAFDLDSQLGSGKYTTQAPGQWDPMGTSGNWFCIIWADQSIFTNTPKVWFSSESFMSETKVLDAISRTLGSDVSPDEVLRFSNIYGAPTTTMQMNIPNALLGIEGESGMLGLSAKCYDSKDALIAANPGPPAVRYASWSITNFPR